MDITAGYRPLQNWLALGQVFFDAPVDGDETVRGQISLVRFGKESAHEILREVDPVRNRALGEIDIFLSARAQQ